MKENTIMMQTHTNNGNRKLSIATLANTKSIYNNVAILPTQQTDRRTDKSNAYCPFPTGA